jgi:hypothetical protein
MTDATPTPPPPVRLFPVAATAAAARGITLMDEKIVAAIQEAIDDNVPQGLIVAVLHAHAHMQTSRMVE